MAQFTHSQYDDLERALAEGIRIALVRRGNELVVMPKRLRTSFGREVLDAVHPTTGDLVEVHLDEVDSFEVLF
ncbi:MAG TPA: hypothetical protein VKZ41_09610 [Gemmatimonadales bacterium]|nr:hypothetical protein [Gemmatimonadales bacterium]